MERPLLIDRLPKKIDEALEQQYQLRLRSKLEMAVGLLKRKGIAMAKIERKLALSQGYLSKLLREPGRSMSKPLVSLVLALAHHPEIIEELDREWNEPSPKVSTSEYAVME